MATIAQLMHCKRVDILDDDDKLLCKAEVDVDSINSLLVIVPRSFEYQAQDDFKTVFYDPIQGLVTCRVSFNAPLPRPGDRLSLRCAITQSISQQNRRMDLKIPVRYNTFAKVIRKSYERTIDPEEGYPAELVNISAGGVYIILPIVLFRFHRISFTFDANGVQVPLIAEILRVEDRSAKGKQLFGYGCRFVEMQPQHESVLRNYVFHRERTLHEKK